MPSVLNQVVTATNIIAGATTVLQHQINLNGRAVLPDFVNRDNGSFTIVATTTSTITVRNDADTTQTGNFWLSRLNSADRAFPGGADGASPQPFIADTGSGVSASALWYNILDYGADPTGVLPSNAAVLAASAAAAAAGGGIVYCPNGDFFLARDGANPWCLDLVSDNVVYVGENDMWFRAPTGLPAESVALMRLQERAHVSFINIGWDGRWGNVVTAIAQDSHGVELPNATIALVDATDLPTSGNVTIVIPLAGPQVVTYTSKSGNVLQGCTGGVGVMLRDQTVVMANSQTGINQATQIDPKNYGVMLRSARHITFSGCRFRQTYGDFIWMGHAFTGSPEEMGAPTSDVLIRDCVGNIGARNGVSFIGTARIRVEDNKFTNTFTQSMDMEAVGLDVPNRDVTITDNLISGWAVPNGGAYGTIFTIVGSWPAGNNISSAAQNVHVENNTIIGALLVDTAIDVRVVHNHFVLDAPAIAMSPAISVTHTADGILIDDNYIYDNTTTTSGNDFSNRGSIQLMYYGDGLLNMQPAGVKVTRNKIHARNGKAGIFINGTGGFTIGDATNVVAELSGTASAVTGTTITTGIAMVENSRRGWTVICGGQIGLIDSNTAAGVCTIIASVNTPTNGWRTPLGFEGVTPTNLDFVITSLSGMVEIASNDIDCGFDGNAAGGYGIHVFGDRAGGRIHIHHNNLKNCTDYGVEVLTDPAKALLSVAIEDNTTWNDQLVTTTLAAIHFANNTSLTGILRRVMRNNKLAGGVAAVLAGLTAGTWLVNDGDTSQWAGFGSPLNVVVAARGSTYQRKDGGANTSFYVKEADDAAATGWVAK